MEPELRDLRELPANGLDDLLKEEITFWREELAWDFETSASLVRKFTDMHALNGYALTSGDRVVGYSYFVYEDHKGLIGDLYVLRGFRNGLGVGENETRLLQAVLAEIRSSGQVRRIESQLMTFAGKLPDGDAGMASYLKTFPRDFLMLHLPMEHPAKVLGISPRITIFSWQERYQENAAQLIRETYRGHVDSEINDQYRSIPGARKFLFNIIQYPGCGNFLAAGSLAAFDTDTGSLAGICLTSVVGEESGHITQLCVAKDWQGRGLGYELLRQSIELLRDRGMRKVSLTVTSENAEALGLYERVGFRKIRHFPAYVWEGF